MDRAPPAYGPPLVRTTLELLTPDVYAKLEATSAALEEGLARALAVDGKPMAERSVKRIAERFRRILRPVKLGHRTVGFRPVDVERLKAHLAGEVIEGCRL